MANIKVLLYDQANLEYDVSYIDEIPLSLSFLIADVKDPSKRNTTFSKTISFNSKDVDLFFRVIWKLNSTLTTFDPRLKCKIKYYVNEVLQLDGDIQLNSVSVAPDSENVTYKTTVTGTISNLFLAIGDAYLTDLDFSAYDHALTKANVTNSWSAATGSGYRYGLINWGQNQVNSETEYHVKHFRPLFYKREYWSKIFAGAGATWTSAYLDSAYYKKQLIPPTVEYLTLSSTDITNSQFYARRNATQTGTSLTATYVSTQWVCGNFGSNDVVLFNEDNVAPYNDAGGQYATATGIFTPATTNTFNLSALLNLDVVLTNDVGTATNAVLNTPSYITVYVTQFNGVTWQPIASSSISLANIVMPTLTLTGQQIYVNLPAFAMNATENYRIEVFGQIHFNLYTAGAVNVATGNTTGKFNIKVNSTYYATLTNNNIIEGATLEVNQCIPTEIKQIDWLMTEIKAANLYIIPNPDKENDYIIEPRDDGFYTGEDDWSEYLDFAKDYEVAPVSALDTKRYEFGNKQDSDEFNDKYFKEYKETYGFGYTDCVSDFVKPVKKTDLIYSPTPLVDNNINGLIVPKIYKNDNGVIKPMKSNIRQLYAGGTINLSYGSWTLKSSLAGDTVYTTYPFVGEVDNPYTPTLSLNWDTPKKVYYKYINATYTDNNLKNKYYSKMINQLSDKRSAVVKAWFNLNERVVKDFSFRKVIWVDHFNSYFYVENFEYVMNTQESTLVTLLKLQDYDTWAGHTIDLPDPDPVGIERIINGNYTNGTNNTNNGNASHIVGGSGNFIEAGAQDIQLSNCTGVVVQGDVIGFRGIGLSNRVVTSADNYITVTAPNTPIVVTDDLSLDASYNNRILMVDATAANITLTWDCANMSGCLVYIIRTDASANTVSINDVDAIVDYIGTAVPVDLAMAQYDPRRITSNGTTIYNF